MYTVLALCRMANDGLGQKSDKLLIQKILHTATLAVAFVPMLAILLMAFQMQAYQLTNFSRCFPHFSSSPCFYGKPHEIALFFHLT